MHCVFQLLMVSKTCEDSDWKSLLWFSPMTTWSIKSLTIGGELIASAMS